MNGFTIKNLWPAAKSFLHILMSPPLRSTHTCIGSLCLWCVCVCFCLCRSSGGGVGWWCGAPSVRTVTTPSINTVRPASKNRRMCNYFVTDMFMEIFFFIMLTPS